MEGTDGAVVVQVLLFLEKLLAQSEVSNFEYVIMYENVSWLNISVNDVVLIEVLKSVEELFEVKEDLFFRRKLTLASLAMNETLEVLVITILQNQID